jgi:hypothetical protein
MSTNPWPQFHVQLCCCKVDCCCIHHHVHQL